MSSVPCSGIAKLRDSLEASYRKRRPKSLDLYRRACHSLPGGDTRVSVHFLPFPTYFARGEGCRVKDVDGNEYIDFVNDYTALVLGHCHPGVVSGVRMQVGLGSAYAAPTEYEILLAEAIRHRVPSIEAIRFCNSGTEATLHALRASRIFTGRPKVIKMDGGYHGSLNPIELASLKQIAEDRLAQGRVHHRKQARPKAVDETISVPVNDPTAVQSAVEEFRTELAAIIIEPMLGSGGCIPAEPSYLHLLRELCSSAGALLIFDEIQTLRLHPGGMQEIIGVRPDLTCLGKMIGGGFPVGAFGGREDIMRMFSPSESHFVPHGGTFNANPISMSAGLITLKLFDSQAIARLNSMGEALRKRLVGIAESLGLSLQVTGIGSIMQVHANPQPVLNSEIARSDDPDIQRCIHLQLLQAGFCIAPRGMLCLSTPMSDDQLDDICRSFEGALRVVQAAIASS